MEKEIFIILTSTHLYIHQNNDFSFYALTVMLFTFFSPNYCYMRVGIVIDCDLLFIFMHPSYSSCLHFPCLHMNIFFFHCKTSIIDDV